MTGAKLLEEMESIRAIGGVVRWASRFGILALLGGNGRPIRGAVVSLKEEP